LPGQREGKRTHYLVTTATGEWDTLICRVPVSAKPIMAKAPISMQIVINRSLGSLILAKKRAPAWWNGEPPTTERESALFLADRPRGHKRRPVKRPLSALFRVDPKP
jgi:hypothetical protein